MTEWLVFTPFLNGRAQCIGISALSTTGMQRYDGHDHLKWFGAVPLLVLFYSGNPPAQSPITFGLQYFDGNDLTCVGCLWNIPS